MLPWQLSARLGTKSGLERESGERHTHLKRTGQHFEALEMRRLRKELPEDTEGTVGDPQGIPRDPKGS